MNSPAKISARSEALEIVKTLALTAALVLVLRTLVFQPFTIPSGSMIPTLRVGDYIFATKYSYGYSRHSAPLGLLPIKGRVLAHPPRRGDVIVFKDPKDDHTDYIKRLIGLPGDRVQLVGGIVYLNGQPLRQEPLQPSSSSEHVGVLQIRETLPDGRSYIIQDLFSGGPADNTPVFLVPEGRYFLMGDNRDNSADSRFSLAEGGIGFVPAANLVGKAQAILASWDGAKITRPWTLINRFDPHRLVRPIR